MKEIIRIKNGYAGEYLKYYNLILYEGEIVYIHCLSEQTSVVLQNILLGVQTMDNGKIYINGKEVSAYTNQEARTNGIYAAAFYLELYQGISIAEALDTLRPFYYPFSKKKTIKDIDIYLQEEGFSFSAGEKLQNLNTVEQKCLGILKGKIQHARLMVVTLNHEELEGAGVKRLRNLICKMNQEGMSFLILSDSNTELARAAHRIQFLNQGRALKEWIHPDENVLRRLSQENLMHLHSIEEGCKRQFIGLYDYEIDAEYNIWQFLYKLQKNNKKIWDTYLGICVPEDGTASQEGTIVIPHDSQNYLLDNMSIGENLTIAAKRRISYAGGCFIVKRLEKILVDSCYKDCGLDEDMQDISELSDVQRKILSIARWEITRPKAIILESPYRSVENAHIPILRAYLQKLTQKGIRIIYFSSSLERMQEDCSLVIRTQDGLNAKIDTF